MITVEVEYTKVIKPTYEHYHYHKVLVKGHANSGSMDSIKCCAGVTAVLGGFKQCVIGIYDKVELKKGYFYYESTGSYHNMKETQIQLDCVIFQLWEIYKCYPTLFKKFEFVEKGEK